MYEAKSAGGNELRYFEDRMNARLHQRVSLESRLRRAVENGDFALHYQPQVRCADQSLVAAEALLRWTDCGRPVPPDQFIPIAEETGLIDPIGEWVLDTAIAQAARWREAHGTDLRIAINLSIKQILRRDILQGLLERIQRAGVAPSLIELEITESVLLNPEGSAIATLRNLRHAGFRLALDDFGTGYSSLSYLACLQLDALKIDKSFIATLDAPVSAANQARDGTAIVHAILAMARQMGLEVVAEGVETAAQHQRLRELGCELCQGYLFSRPLPPDEFARSHLATARLPH
jgi:EAL domain-containing protein (putative c-di-GMP-specific phosphodiesterase class I)